MEFDNLELSKADRVATIMLNRPKAINSLNQSMLRELEAALCQIEHDDNVDVVILTAAGDKGFCAGMDLKDFEAGNTDLSSTKAILDSLEDFSKPTIGAISDGYCITGGLELALSCDILIASDKAIFGDTHSRINVSGGGAAVRMPRLIGLMQAKHMIFTSRFFDAQRAKEIGLIIDFFPSGLLYDEAKKLALEITKQDQVILRRMKQIMNRGWRTDLYSAWCLEEAECRRSMQMQMAKGFQMNAAVNQSKPGVSAEETGEHADGR